MIRTRPLGELLDGVGGVRLDGDPSIDISDVVLDSRQARPGSLFAALEGGRDDGMRYVPEAISSGASAILAATPRATPVADVARVAQVAWIQAEAPRLAVALIARNFHGRPDERLIVTGITGTNGKTTVSHILYRILGECDREAGLIGTLDYRVGRVATAERGNHETARVRPASRTTPEAPDLYRLLAEMVDAGCSDAILEVSSHGLAQERVAGLSVSTAVFTNLSRDHLDFHGDMEAYAASKRRLFSEHLGDDGTAVAGADDPAAGGMLASAPSGARRLTFGFAPGCDVRIASSVAGPGGTQFSLELPGGARADGRTPLTGMTGRPGLLNLAAAIAASVALGLDPMRALRAAEGFPGVPGRFERIDQGQDFAVIVDFAHTPDALENLLVAVRESSPRRVITLFGCGGDRDRGKRPAMGAAAMRGSDHVFLTSDNPRTEDPASILNDAEAGVLSVSGSRGRYTLLEDRREAICAAIAMAAPGDAVVIAGKGHETEQILSDRTVPFDDRKEAAAALDVRLGKDA